MIERGSNVQFKQHTFMKKILPILFLTFINVIGISQVFIYNLLCENQPNPIGLDVKQPRFTWTLKSDKRNVKQSAYEIRLSTNAADLTKGKSLLWQTNKVTSDASVYIPYTGIELISSKRYYWQVRVWDNEGKESAWSDVAFFQTGLLSVNDWSALWINSGLKGDTVHGIVPIFRKTFSTTKKVQSAFAYITAQGMYEAHINGQRVGDAYLTPGWTSYNKRLQYQVFDVTNLLTQGKNAIGVQLGSGWFRTQLGWVNGINHYGKETGLLLQLEIAYTDGSREKVISDGSWKVSTGAIKYSEIYNGEIYDAREEKTGWLTPQFDDSKWGSVVVKNFTKSNIIATFNEPIRKKEVFKPVKIITTPNGEQVIDFGQNLVGWVQLKARGKAGDTIKWRHFEVLDKKGNVYLANMRAAKTQSTYILRGVGEETYEPRFTFFGFRYIWVQGVKGRLNPDDFTAITLYSDMKPTGTFECSNPLVNQLQHNIQWGQRGNFLDVPTDCPQRDERLGWTGDAQAFSRTASFNFNVHNFFSKWLKDVAADQLPNGAVPHVIPNVLGPTSSASAGWADVANIAPWNMYLAYGDKRILENQYESMKAWVNYMKNQSKNDLWNTGFHFGDWLFFSAEDDNDGRSAVTDKYLIAQCFWAHSTQLLINAARVLGKKEDEIAYSELLNKIK
jgi:alpha-L-rhamnosidase